MSQAQGETLFGALIILALLVLGWKRPPKP